MQILSFLCLLSLSLAAIGQVYKWVDADGVTHYSSIKPQDQEAEPFSVYKSNTMKAIPQEAQPLIDAAKKEILRDKGDSDKVNCPKAVANAKDVLDTMYTTGRKNVADGYASRERYMEVEAGLKKIERRISIAECQTARGDVLGFYKCMSNPANHIVMCGSKYHYGE